MNPRLTLFSAATAALLAPLLYDIAIKGVLLLVAAGLVVLGLRRASAAARHLVWLVALVALLAVPVLTVALPGWRVLPAWAAWPERPAVSPSMMPSAAPTIVRVEAVPAATSIPAPPGSSFTPAPAPIDPRPSTPGPASTRRPAQAPVSSPTPTPSAAAWAVAAWTGGFLILVVRLVAAQWVLRRARRRAEPCQTGPLVEAMAEAAKQLGLGQRVCLRLDARRTIPLVWGVLRPCLLLPAEAHGWGREQLRSVLLHELAHIKRRDPLVQALAQGTLALHWFNPLAWLAVWRLHVERERACDDLVLASGVRGSEYATHLLRVASELTPAPWTSACGLAMARRSSLEGRLLAVLNDRCDRRGMTRALTAAALLLSLALAIPVAMLKATEDPRTPPGAALPSPASVEPAVKPKHESAQSLLKKWQSRARTDGQIPGALVGQLAQKIEEFIKQYPDASETPKLMGLRPRFEAAAARDWDSIEIAGLLDDVAAIATAPLGWSSLPLEFDEFRTLKTGQPLPVELTSAAWGPPAENGLRAAWLLEPGAEQYALGTVLKVRVLFHNAGTEPVVFRTETWHQNDTPTVRDARGADVETSGTWYTGITPLANFRLLPGEYCEVSAPGVAIGAGTYEDERSTGRVGVIIEAKEGDELSLSCLVDAAQGVTFSRPDDPKDPIELWKKQAADRVASEAPLPSTPADREQLIRRVLLDLTGVPPTAEEISQFVADPDPNALQTLTARIQAKDPTPPWTGKLPTGTTQFRVLAADPDAAKAPRSANGPGRYVLGDTAQLQVTQTGVWSPWRLQNSARIIFLSPDRKVPSPHQPYEIALPDGTGTYGIVWERGAGVLWVMQKNLVRKYSFDNPAQVKEMTIEPGNILNIPAPLQDTMKQAFNVAGPPVQQQNGPQPAGGAMLDAATETQLDWGEASFGLRGALMIRSPGAGQPEGIYLVVQNVSDGPRRFMDTTKSERLRTLYLSDTKGVLAGLSNDEPTMTDVTLQPREVAFLNMMRSDGSAEVSAGLIEGIRKDSLQKWFAVLRMEFSVLGGGWSGTLTTGESRCAVRDGGPLPKNDRAQALFKHWQSSARLNGDIPGGLVRLLHEKVKEFIRNNEPDASGGPYAQKMKPLEPRFANTGDWKPADLVALLDDIAAAHTIPLDNTLSHLAERTLQPGTPLPASLENADWGEPLPSGLRVAHLLEPRAGAYHLGTELKARILFHNVGKEPVTFITDTFQQPGHSAKRADGSELKLDATYWTTLGSMAAYRLAPGDYCEIHTPGLGIGARDKDRDDWANVRAGSWILCAEGDEVVFTPGAAALSYRETAEPPADWWLDFITERLNREAPVPTDTKEREYLLYRVVRDLYGAAPSTTEGDAFAADTSPDALKNLAALIAKHPYGKRSDGVVRAGSTTFRVLPPDSDADKRPRIATGPGWYSLSDTVKFSVTRSAAGSRVINEASIIHFQQGQDNVVHKVALPNGYDTWAAGMMKGATELWIAEAGTLRKYDFANPLQPLETRYEAGTLSDAPISNELRAVLDPVLSQPAPDAPKLKRSSPPPAAAPAAPATEKPKGGAAPAAVATPPPAAADHVRVALTKDGVITYGRRAMTLDELRAAAKVDAKKWFTIDADTDVPFAKVTEVVEALKSSGVTEITFQAARVGDGRYRVANRTGSYEFDGQHKFSICKLTSGPHRFAVIWPARNGEPLRTLRMYPQNGEQTRGKWAVVWEPGTEVLWWIDDLHVGKMIVTDPTAVVVDRESRSGAFSLEFALPEGVLTEFRRLGFEVGGGSGEAKRTREVLKAGPPYKTQTAEAHEEGLLTPDGLIGTWRGTVNGEKLTMSFHRPPAEEEVHCDIYFGEATIGVLAAFSVAEDGGSAEVVQHTAGGGMKFGTLIPSEAGKLKLELYGRQKGEQETMLTRDAELAASEPRQAEARELFDMWKRTANADGTIPGTFIGMLATEVRAYVKANPTLDSAAKLPKLLSRFVTSRDWTQAEAINLLDDVAYYSTKPIEACVAKAKLPSGPLWRTMVEFQDSPVEIAKWSEVKDGLRLGLRVVGGQWSAGGSVRVELWLHNAGDKDVSFRTAGPNRQDVEVMYSAIDSEGKEHWPEINPLRLIAPLLDCTLPAGHVAMAKEFDVTFADADNDVNTSMGHRFLDLKPGQYQLRCSWMCVKPAPAPSDARIELKAPDFAFMLGGASVQPEETKPAPKTGAAGERENLPPHDWNVRVVDGSTGREQAGVTLVAWVFAREGGQGRRVEHVTDGRDWAIELAENEYATVACEDAVWVGGGGSFHIGNVPPENPDAAGNREGARHTDSDTPFELRIWRGDTVKGRVRLPGGKPAAGMQVMLGARIDGPDWIQRLGLMNMNQFSFDHGEHPNWHSMAVTNEQGEFEGALPPSEANTFTTLSCGTRDTLRYEEKWEPAQVGDDTITIQLEAGVRLHGRVVDTDGKPVARAEVFASGQHRHEDSSLTDAEGRYELRARPGVARVSVDIRERNEKGEVTSHNATGIHAPENVVIPDGAAEYARDVRIMRVTDAGPVLPPEGKPQRERSAAVSFLNYGKPLSEFGWVEGPWGPEINGLSLALELDTDKTDQWRPGGTVQGELYVRNTSAAPVTFPQHFAMHVGLAVTARDKDGKDHPARITQWEGCPALHHLTLPPDHAARVKIFTLQLDPPDSPARKTGASLELAPGPYTLRARWSDAHALWAHEGEWTGALESGEVDFAVSDSMTAVEEGAKSASLLAKQSNDPYSPVGVEIAQMPVANLEWCDAQNGLCVGLLVPEDRDWRIGGEAKVELWVCNPGEKDVKFHHIGRNDIGLRVKLRGADGKEHDATIAQYDGYPVFTKHLLKAGHAFKAREFTVRLAKPVDSTPDPWFALPAGDYTFRCELNIPGTTATDATGTQRIPAEGEWSGTIKTGEVAVKLVAADEHRAVRKNAVGTASPAFAAPGLHPTSTRLWNDTHAAYAVQSEKEVNFVLLYEGVLSTGMSESWSGTTDYWAFEGSIHLVDREKTKAAGQNVDKRVIAVKYASDAPTMLYLDGKAYDLANPPAAGAKGVGPLPGRLFILREEGDPIQTDRTLPLRHEQDLATLGTFARQDRVTDTAREGTRQTPKGGGVALAINPANSPSASKESLTVDVTIEATVARPLSGLKDFDLEITGHLHSASTDPSRSPWRWKNQSPITGGRLVVPIPAGLTDVKLTAGPVGSRPGDSPVFVWQREAPVLSDWIGLGTVTEPVHFRLRVEDAAELRVTVKAPDGGKPTNVRLDARTEGGSVAPLALTEWNQADTPDAFVRAIRLPACERVQLNVLADLSAPATQKFGPLAAGEVTEVHVALQEARDLHWIATGRVIDPDGKPMAGVLIAVHAGMGSLRQTGRATTDADGRYTVRFSPGIRGGTQTHLLQFANITAHKPGFVEKNINAHGAGAMAIGESARQDFMAFGMKPDQLALRGKPRSVDFSMRPVE